VPVVWFLYASWVYWECFVWFRVCVSRVHWVFRVCPVCFVVLCFGCALSVFCGCLVWALCGFFWVFRVSCECLVSVLVVFCVVLWVFGVWLVCAL
jgi:hypothetical protein